MARAVDVAIVGAGVIGLGIAWRAASAGATVAVCDPEPGRGASWVAAGMLAPVTEASIVEAPLTRLGLDSARRWPAFAEELSAASGIDVGLRDEGTLAVAFDADDRRHLEQLAHLHRSLGLESEWLTPSECRKLESRLSPRIRGGLRVAGDWQVDNRAVVTALLRVVGPPGVGAADGGVTHYRQLVRRLVAGTGGSGGGSAGGSAGSGGGSAGGRIGGVELDDGTVIRADTVVLAAGAASAHLEGLAPEARPPVRPVKGEILRLAADPADPVLAHTVRASVEGRSVYLVPRRHGEVVVGATTEEGGFDTRVRAGAVQELLDAAVDLLPEVRELELVEARAGLRPGTPDNGPILGRGPAAGLVYATGHYRNGMLLTPVTLDAIASVLAGDDLPEVAAPFTLERFT